MGHVDQRVLALIQGPNGTKAKISTDWINYCKDFLQYAKDTKPWKYIKENEAHKKDFFP